ncbi:PAS domain-containing protein [Legionella tunisiensis]|uniref:PAS domain-containing protein n=1 Tax=Legionella tunisiensis TaxID=1034944 RepID=UPI0003744D07|nr:PAS domain-containing protein [Legionella tunisiensis]
MKTEEPLLLNHLENLFELTSANVYSKDTKGCYLSSNQAMLKVNNIRSEQEIIGATDYDLLWKERASVLIQNDQEVIQTNKAKTYIESVRLNSKILQCYISHKTPLRTSLGKVIGVFGLSFYLKMNIL